MKLPKHDHLPGGQEEWHAPVKPEATPALA